MHHDCRYWISYWRSASLEKKMQHGREIPQDYKSRFEMLHNFWQRMQNEKIFLWNSTFTCFDFNGSRGIFCVPLKCLHPVTLISFASSEFFMHEPFTNHKTIVCVSTILNTSRERLCKKKLFHFYSAYLSSSMAAAQNHSRRFSQ